MGGKNDLESVMKRKSSQKQSPFFVILSQFWKYKFLTLALMYFILTHFILYRPEPVKYEKPYSFSKENGDYIKMIDDGGYVQGYGKSGWSYYTYYPFVKLYINNKIWKCGCDVYHQITQDGRLVYSQTCFRDKNVPKGSQTIFNELDMVAINENSCVVTRLKWQDKIYSRDIQAIKKDLIHNVCDCKSKGLNQFLSKSLIFIAIFLEFFIHFSFVKGRNQ